MNKSSKIFVCIILFAVDSQRIVAQETNDSGKTYSACYKSREDNYDIKLYFFNSNNYIESEKNSILTISKINQKKSHIIYADSLFCMEFFIDSSDFTNQGVKDLMVESTHGARANVFYHLFTIRGDNVIKINGFENLSNPQTDDDIIYSTGMYADRFSISFYRIKDYQLIDLNKNIDIDLGDSTQFNQAIKDLKNQEKK